MQAKVAGIAIWSAVCGDHLEALRTQCWVWDDLQGLVTCSHPPNYMLQQAF